MADVRSHEAPLPIAEAFARLPLESPDASAWPLLSARLAKQQRKPRWQVAAAAAVLIGLGWMLFPRGEAPTQIAGTDTSASGTSSTPDLAGLMAESARLERLVAAASDDGASSANTAALGLALEDSLRSLDSELAVASDPAAQLALWQQRVEVLRDVASLETSRHYLASQGQSLDVALVAAY
ncbi:hypothetical protein [Arenimonas oryziterrae]|uniref:Uncharacterized protein n=1 Tax=Arenimonas oryziterrae DSM 21050 = YC6267 TaxID=1121015 RepID=A0A091AW76_9GAMM|nr:hypothetical protein [Arenimonas oryziterrae]KFN43527.1 hypothetical protein N789_09640 [Arenimonas oryziterrae DSM 21050 = YC6267]